MATPPLILSNYYIIFRRKGQAITDIYSLKKNEKEAFTAEQAFPTSPAHKHTRPLQIRVCRWVDAKDFFVKKSSALPKNFKKWIQISVLR